MSLESFYKGKTVFITGGSSGIGLETARDLARYGADSVLFARKKGLLEKAVSDIKGEGFAGKAEYRVLDVTDEKKCLEVIDEAVASYGIPDIVINSAGTAFSKRFDETPLEDMKWLYEVNVFGTRNFNFAVIPHLKKKGEGIIVNLSSLAGLVGNYGYASYGATKFAVAGMTEAMKAELKSFGIKVHVVCPPEVETPLIEEELKHISPEAKAVKVMAGVLKPKDVSRAILKGIKRGKYMIIPGFMARMSYRAYRLMPGVVRMVMDIVIKKNMKV